MELIVAILIGSLVGFYVLYANDADIRRSIHFWRRGVERRRQIWRELNREFPWWKRLLLTVFPPVVLVLVYAFPTILVVCINSWGLGSANRQKRIPLSIASGVLFVVDFILLKLIYSPKQHKTSRTHS